MELKDWHYRIWSAWQNKVYGNSLNQSNFKDDGRIHHQNKFYKVTNNETNEFVPPNPSHTYYVKLVKGNEFFLLPKTFLKDFPVMPKNMIDVHLKPSESQVWKLILSVDSLNIPIKKCFEFKPFIKQWNPIKHEDQRTSTFLKLVALSKGIKLGICAGVGGGKNSNLTLLRHIKQKVAPKVKRPTMAKFYQLLYFNDYINIDEITSWKNAEVNVIEELVAEMGDEAPDLDKFSCDKNRLMETIKNANDKSLTFTFNPPSIDNPHMFSDAFKNYDKIRDRYPIFLVKGKVVGSIQRPTNAKAESMMEINFKEMCDIASTEAYYRANTDKELHRYDRSKSTLLQRYKNNISPLLDLFDVYCDSKAEFECWLLWINNRHNDYEDMCKLNKEGNDIFNVGYKVKEEKV